MRYLPTSIAIVAVAFLSWLAVQEFNGLTSTLFLVLAFLLILGLAGSSQSSSLKER